jgi:hypothetical protein|tara:strand:+ start:203 stop:421 length:219 start_codon:yes stop_codon:yes gene_type:complete
MILGGLAYIGTAALLRATWLHKQVKAEIDAGNMSAGGLPPAQAAAYFSWVVAAAWPVFVGQALYKFWRRRGL